MLDKLSANRDKKVEITLKNGKRIRCLPQQYLEEEYESYLVEAYETYGGYAKGMLIELTEDEIENVILL